MKIIKRKSIKKVFSQSSTRVNYFFFAILESGQIVLHLVWPDLFFCKHLSLVVNKQDQSTMKMAMKIFLAFPLF